MLILATLTILSGALYAWLQGDWRWIGAAVLLKWSDYLWDIFVAILVIIVIIIIIVWKRRRPK